MKQAILKATMPVEVYASSFTDDAEERILTKIGLLPMMESGRPRVAEQVLGELENAFNSLINNHHGFAGEELHNAVRVGNWLQGLILACKAQPKARFNFD